MMGEAFRARNRCVGGAGIRIDLDAATGRILRRRLPDPRHGSSGPWEPGEIARRGSASFVVAVENDRPVVKALDVPTGRTMWVSSLPDPHHQLFKRPNAISSAVGVLDNDSLYVAVASDGSDFSGCGD
jgi:hypothetical protein